MEIIKSAIEKYNFKSFADLHNDIKQYKYVVIYKSDCVLTLYTKDITELTGFLELRAFDEKGELRILYTGSEYLGRIRRDGDGTDKEVLDEYHLLWGLPKSIDGEYTYMSEDRGTKLRLPVKATGEQRAFMHVRNYLSESDFEFTDFRFVDFVIKEAKEYA